MVTNVYSVRDVNGSFLSMFCEVNDEVAKRNFVYSIIRDDHMSTFCKDFDLMNIGKFDTDTGEMIPATPVRVLDGSSAKLIGLDLVKGVN